MLLQRIPIGRNDKPNARPIITRTRSWRGVMQVVFDETRQSRSSNYKHALFYAPLRVMGMALMCYTFMYFYFGHDQFFYQILGYESEAIVEHRVNAQDVSIYEGALGDKGYYSNVRKLEQDRPDKLHFDIYKDMSGRNKGKEVWKNML